MPLWSLSFAVAFSALPAVLPAATPSNHYGFQGNPAFLEVQSEKRKSDATTMNLAPMHAKTKHDEAQGAQSGHLLGILAMYVPSLPGLLMMVEYMPHKQGLFFVIFGAMVLLGAAAGVTAWNEAFPEEKEEGAAADITADRGLTPDKFGELSDNGELDFYTCMALSLGHDKSWAALAKFAPKLIVLLCLQLVLPLMLMRYQTTRGHFLPAEQDLTYRVIGSALFAFSAWNLCQGMVDECRLAVVNMVRHRHSSGWIAWPILFGSYMSTCLALNLTVILFLIFSDCSRPQDLLINCIAINFVVEVDNALVSSGDSAGAAKHYLEFLSAWENSPAIDDVLSARSEHKISGWAAGAAWVQHVLLKINNAIRQLVPVVALIGTFLFAFGNNESVCHYMRDVEPFPFCFPPVSVVSALGIQ